MTSREKILAYRQRLIELKPEDEKSARDLQLLIGLSPMLLRLLPEEAGEIDRYLKFIAVGAAACRSDEAAKVGVFEYTDDGWKAVKIDALG